MSFGDGSDEIGHQHHEAPGHPATPTSVALPLLCMGLSDCHGSGHTNHEAGALTPELCFRSPGVLIWLLTVFEVLSMLRGHGHIISLLIATWDSRRKCFPGVVCVYTVHV